MKTKKYIDVLHMENELNRLDKLGIKLIPKKESFFKRIISSFFSFFKLKNGEAKYC